MAPSVLSTTLSLVGLQVASRLFSFGLNQALLRSTTPQAFGLATIKLDTLVGTVLFLLREGIRGAVVRTRSSTSPAGSTLQNQSLLLPTLLTPLAVAAFALYHAYASPSRSPPYYTTVVGLYLASAVIELLSEPLYLRTLQSWETLTTRRVRVEGAAVFTKAVATLVAVRSVSEDDALLAFGIGQLVYSATIWAGLAWVVPAAPAPARQGEGRGLRRVDGRLFDPAIMTLGWALAKQSVVKQLLTEGDKLAVGKFGSSADMGGYAVALNYGSLLARVVFQPLEESSRLYFSSLSASGARVADDDVKAADGEKRVKSNTGRPAYSTFDTPPSPATLASVASYLRLLLLLYTHLALIFLLLAPAYTTPLLHLLLGARWSSTSAAPLLRTYALSLPFLACNGLTEAFFQSVAPPRWLARGSAWMVLCAAAFAAMVYGTMRGAGWGAEGLVAANCVNLAMRTALSSVFIARYFAEAAAATGAGGNRARAELKPQRWMPKSATVAAFTIAGWVVRRSEKRWEGAVHGGGKGVRATAEHLALGAAAGVTCLAVVALSHRAEIRERLAARRRGVERKAE
ncbi:Oligosaccharide translocation protein rft1 [Rhodotorula kratochvilovae]